MLQHAYYESKKYALLFASVLVIPFLVGVIYYAHIEPAMSKSLIIGGLLFVLIAFTLFLLIYPSARLEMYVDRMVYKKGKTVIDVKWFEVKYIAFDLSQGPAVGKYIYFDTTKGKTALVDTMILQREGGPNKRIDRNILVDEIEKISGKKVLIGQYSFDRYSQGTYRDWKGPVSR